MKTYRSTSNFIRVIVVSSALSILFPATHALAAGQMLKGHVPPVVASLQPIGTLSATQQLSLAIGFPLRNSAELTNLLHDIYNPTSPKYHQYISPAQFREAFGPTEEDYKTVTAFAQAHHLTVTYAHSNRMILDVTGKIADIEDALHVRMRVYNHPAEVRTFYAPDVEPSLDLTVPVMGIEGLNNYALARRNSIATPIGNVQGAQSNGGSGPGGEYAGYDFRDAYLPGVALTGSGQTVGLLEFDGYATADINAYENTTGLPSVPLANVLVDGFNGLPSGTGGEIEVCLDIEMAIAMAPGLSKIIVYETANSINLWHDLLNRMADDDLAKQLSCSWFIPNGAADPVAEQIFQQMAAQGQSFFVASGDSDAYTGLIPFPSDSPNVTEVGGTTLNTTGPNGNWAAEAVWNWNVQAGCGSTPDIGSSGGISTHYAIPTWQTGVATSGNQGSTTMRNVPDVALTADNILIVADGANQCVAGTSAAAPLWAGFTALVNEQAAANGASTVGFLNPALYAIGRGSSYGSDFHDITTANNESSSSPNQFSAVSGYDLCTGWGTPNAQLINDLTGSCLFTPIVALSTTRSSQTATLLPNGLVLVAGGINGSSYLTSAELYNPATGTWTPTGSLHVPRGYHTATLLPSGQVLVAGGLNSGGALQTTELYNPASGTWGIGPPNSMNTARYSHTATLLPNGLVLVAGGIGTSGTLMSAELYNPATLTWTSTGAMSVGHDHHTATLLPNGLVLAAAGFSSGVTAIAELYNPATGRWTTTGSLHTARESHTATLLPNGLVLVAGGFAGVGHGISSIAELYNPATGAWATTGSLNTGRENHTATLLPDGLVLVTGGVGQTAGFLATAELYNPATALWTTTCSLNTAREFQTATLLPNGFVLVAAGVGSTGSALSSAELYPISSGQLTSTGTWINSGSMNTARFSHTATLLPNGLMLAAGGMSTGNSYLNAAETYNPASGHWTTTGSLNTARVYHTATLMRNGLVLAAGGQNSSGVIGSAELYTPATGNWTTTGPLNFARQNHTMTLLPNGLVLVAGGIGTSSVLASAELYNPATGQWTTTGSLNTARYYHTATLLPNGLVLVATGFGGIGGLTTSAELYNPATGQWTTTGSLNQGRYFQTQTLLPNGLVLVAGGADLSVGNLTSAELYDPSSGMWTATGSLNTARKTHTATLLPFGLVLVTGGYGTGPLNSVELYDPPTGTWTSTSLLNLATSLHTATLLPNGSVLVVGGNGASGVLHNSEFYNQ